jgi:hypothetical protein
VKQKVAIKDKKKKLRPQINGKYNDINNADENKYKKITVEPLFKNSRKTIHIFINRRLRNCNEFVKGYERK